MGHRKKRLLGFISRFFSDRSYTFVGALRSNKSFVTVIYHNIDKRRIQQEIMLLITQASIRCIDDNWESLASSALPAQ